MSAYFKEKAFSRVLIILWQIQLRDERFSNYLPTNEEVQRLLEDTGNIKYQGQIKKWYDGYCLEKDGDLLSVDVLCYLE